MIHRRLYAWLPWLVPAIVAVVTVVVFLPVLRNDFVGWDDDRNFLHNSHYRGLGWTQLRWMFTTFHMGHYIPLTWLTLGADDALWGMNPAGYHLTNLLLHTASALVLYLLVCRLLRLALAPALTADPAPLAVAAGFGALLFAVHPLRVESVAWATERRDVLSALFYLLTLVAYLRARDGEPERRRWYWLSVALFACALLSKSMAVSVPLVLLILDVYPLLRVGGAAGWWNPAVRRIYAEKVPFALLAMGATVLAFVAIIDLGNLTTRDRLGVGERLLVSVYNVGFYLAKMTVPVSLSPLYELPADLNTLWPRIALSAALVLVVTGLAVALRRRWPGLLAAWAAYVVVMLPVLGIFHNGPQISADRYTYLASAGWSVLLASGVIVWCDAWRTGRVGARTTIAGAVFATLVVLVLGTMTWDHARV